MAFPPGGYADSAAVHVQTQPMKTGLLGWFSASLVIGVLSVALYSRHVRAPQLANDSYQYLDAASHVASGSCLCTDVAHFDEQVKWGHMPIPLTHFGPGYPVAIAALKALGLPLETGGYLLSVAGYLAVICLVWLIGFYLAIQRWALALICLIWSLNPNALDYGVSVATDCLFTALLTAICALVAYDIRNLTRPRPAVLLAMGVLTGGAYWLRQPGLFLFLPLLLYLVWRYALNSRSGPYALGSAALTGLLMAPVTIRNVVFAHSWNSGFANGRHTPWKDVFSDTLKAPDHIVFGDSVVARFSIWMGIILLSLFVVLWRALANRHRGLAPTRLDETKLTILAWLLVYTVTFTAGILAAELSTYAASEVRYNFPVFPLVLLMCAFLFQLASDKIGRVAALACVLSVAVLDARSLMVPHPPDQSSLPADLLQQQVQPGVSMRTYIEKTLPARSVLIATEGQAVYYLLKRPVVSIIEPQYSLHAWDEADFRSVMQSFRAQYVLVFPGAGKVRAPEQQASPFLQALTAGNPPDWLIQAARSPGAILYRRADSFRAAPSTLR